MGETSRVDARQAILGAALRVLTAEAAGAATVDRIAKAAGCAKGLVHYHFKTKEGLLSEVATGLWAGRAAEWRQALSTPDPGAALDAAWRLLQAEAGDGRLRASVGLGLDSSGMVGQSVRQGRVALSGALADGLVQLFAHMSRTATVPPSEMAALLGALIDGLGLQLAAGEPARRVEPAWSAFWAALLSLTCPA